MRKVVLNLWFISYIAFAATILAVNDARGEMPEYADQAFYFNTAHGGDMSKYGNQGDVVVWVTGYFWGIGVHMGGFVWTDIEGHTIITDYGQYARRHRQKYDDWYAWYKKGASHAVRWKPDMVIPIGRFLEDEQSVRGNGGNDERLKEKSS